jgi:hypothetical protein
LRLKSWFPLILIGLFILAGGALYLTKISILCLENTDRSKSHPIRVSPSERFTVVYIHSIYREPVEELFQIHEGTIVLKGVRTRHPGILEYYGFEDTKQFHPMDRRLGVLLFRVAMGEPQSLQVRDRRVSFREVGERGDQVRLRFKAVSLGHYLFHRVFPLSFIHDIH